jgi:regulator of protease activity HflC (stomatin/prohibitin superfamily)
MVEVKHIDLPENMQRAMAMQAEAERERRSKIIRAEGEYQASAKLTEAAKVLENHPVSIQLRFLQTLVEIAGDKSNTIVLPIPLDLIKGFMEKDGFIAKDKK